MKISGSFVITSDKGEQVLVMLSKDFADQKRLHHYLAIDAFEFKKNIAERIPEIEYISTGILNASGQVEWSEDYIELPNWYDLN